MKKRCTWFRWVIGRCRSEKDRGPVVVREFDTGEGFDLLELVCDQALHSPHPVVHLEVLGIDAPRLQRFYAELFGWKITLNPVGYGYVPVAPDVDPTHDLDQVLDAMHDQLRPDSLVLTDSGFHCEDNLQQLAARKIDALIADNGMRKRDERFAQQGRHRAKPDPLWNKAPKPIRTKRFEPKDFFYDEQAKVCICPAGEFLYQNGADVVIDGRHGVKFKCAQRICGPCPIREQCLRHPHRTKVRQVVFFNGHNDAPKKLSARMRERIDTEHGRRLYGQRLGIVEPVFGNLRYNKGLDRFALRGRDKVDGQWKLFCLVHNIEKLAHHRYGQ